MLSPALVDGFHGNVIDATHRVHLLGHRLMVKGFPYMSQHTDISVCAHVACCAILRHYSERYSQYAEFLTYDVTRMAHEFDPDLVRVVMELSLLQFVWIVEISSVDQWKAGQIETRVVIDATASTYEDDPLFLMYDLTRAYVFDRGSDHSHSVIKLNSPQGAVLSRMTGNLKQHTDPLNALQRLRMDQPQISGDAR